MLRRQTMQLRWPEASSSSVRTGWIEKIRTQANCGEAIFLRMAYHLTERFGEDVEEWKEWLDTYHESIGDVPGYYVRGVSPEYTLRALAYDRDDLHLLL